MQVERDGNGWLFTVAAVASVQATPGTWDEPSQEEETTEFASWQNNAVRHATSMYILTCTELAMCWPGLVCTAFIKFHLENQFEYHASTMNKNELDKGCLVEHRFVTSILTT